MTDKFKSILMIISILFSIFTISLLAQEQTYDPAKEPPFDKDQAIKELKEVVTTQNAANVNRYIIDKYIQTERYKAAIFILDSLRNIPQYDQRHFMVNEQCLCHYFIGEKEYGLKCIQENYFTQYYSKIDINKIEQSKKYSLLRKYDYDIIFILLIEGLTSFNDQKIIPLIEILIDNFLCKYNDVTDAEMKKLISQKERFRENREFVALRNKRKELRRKQILDYIHELEQILVDKNELKLSLFFYKYSVADFKRLVHFVKRYKKCYFNKNYREIHFQPIADSSGESIHIMGSGQENVTIEFVIKTVPESKGEKCPETIRMAFGPDLYCHSEISFKFIADEIYVH